jgi:tetratricopeptide (TPR) repeat protein
VGVKAARLALLAIAIARPSLADPSADRFREANDLVRAGDYPKAVALYQRLASSGQESASLYWNWAQAAAARGAQGEALWALLRARELDPGDRAVARDVQRLREALNLDRAEIAPEPLAAVGRFARRFRLDLVALALLALSVLAHGLVRLGFGRRAAGRLAWSALGLGLLAAAVPVAASFARPTAAVVRRGAPLLDSASPTAEATGSLREGEVVPVLESSGEWVRVEDNAGARGWAHVADARRLGVPPEPPRD